MSQKKSVNLKELDFNNIGAWPQQWKMVLCGLLTVGIVLVAWVALMNGERDALLTLERDEVALRKQVEDEQGKGAYREPLRQQLAQMVLVLQQMLPKLPCK